MRRLEAADAGQEARAARRGLSLYPTDDGDYEIRGRLSPEVGALLLKALEVDEARIYREQRAAGTEHRTSVAQRRAEALGLWLEERLQPQVQLVVHSFQTAAGEEVPDVADAPLSVVTEDGVRVSAETSGPWTGTTLWQGERPDLDWALAWFWLEGGGGGDRPTAGTARSR